MDTCNHAPEAKLLLVDDDLLFAWSASVELCNAGFDVTALHAGDDPTFLDHVRDADVVVLDVSLPGASGFTLVHEIRSHADTADVPIVMLTALKSKDYQMHALSVGADDVFVKPPDWHQVANRIEALLLRAGMGRPA